MNFRFACYAVVVGALVSNPLYCPASAEELRAVPDSNLQMQLSFSPLVKRTAASVVNVYADKQVARPSLFSGDPFFDQFFGQRMPNRTEKQSSLGSGVIIDKKGVILTNNHVIDGADNVRVALADGREFAAKVTFKDARLDLALLKIEGDPSLHVLPIGDSDAVEVGDLVLAMGDPFGVGQTVTSGIVSGLARNKIGEGDFSYFIQTDASINPGNSGGPLIDMKGELIGINTAIFSKGGGSNGIGFAIPANLVKVFVAAAQGGQPGFTRPYIGATFEPVTSDVAEALGLKIARGALVSKVVDGGPAANAGLKPGDVVTAVNGHAVEHPDALGYRLTTAGLGSTAMLKVLRNGAEREASIKLEQAPETHPKDERLIEGRNPFAGALVANLSPRLADAMQMPTDAQGVVIEEVTRGSPAARLGFEPKDIIVDINGEAITSTGKLQDVVTGDASFWRVEIERDGQRIRQFIR